MLQVRPHIRLRQASLPIAPRPDVQAGGIHRFASFYEVGVGDFLLASILGLLSCESGSLYRSIP